MAGADHNASVHIREMCRRLKPVIGQQAERIWLAYAAEDADGKQQIEDYLELLSSHYFQANLDSQGPGLVPPEATAAAGEYALGSVSYNGRALYPFGLRENEWTQHVGVFGRSGAGKTNIGFLVVQELVQAGKPVLVFDWKRNYRDLLGMAGMEQMAVYTIGRPIAPFSFNPLIPPPMTNPQTWLKKIIAVVAHAYLLGDGVMYLLQEAIDRVYEEAGVYSGSVDHWPTFRDVLAVLKARQTSGREAGWLSSALRAMSSLCFGEMDTLVNVGHTDLAGLLTRPVVLELDALTQSDKVFFAEAVLLWIHHLRMAEPTREEFKHIIVLEEAHHLLSGERQALVGGQSVLDITFREIREFGESIVYLDQHPSQISMPALGNTYATICFNLKHRADVSAMSQAMLLQDEEKNLLGELQVGQAVVRLQGRSVRPFLIAVPEFPIRKGSVTDIDVMHHMTQLGLLSARHHAPVPGPVMISVPQEEPAPAAAVTERVASGQHRLLADIAHYPDSGIAERYKRLGISVRQGQKLKDELASQGLIRQELQTTSRGMVRVIRLTEQGQLALQPGGWDDPGADQAA